MFVEQVLAEMKHLDAESQRLRDQVTKNDERSRLLRAYIDVDQEFAKAGSKQQTDGPALPRVSTSDRAGRSKSRRITDLAVDLIAAKGRPIRTRDLLPQMEQHGFPMGGRSPVATLSGFLCRDKKRLANNRRLGWRLVEWGGDKPPR